MQSPLLLGHTARYVRKSFPSAFSADKMAVKGAIGKNFSCQHSEHLQKVIKRRRRNNSHVMTSVLACQPASNSMFRQRCFAKDREMFCGLQI